jgi:hypothetical protein
MNRLVGRVSIEERLGWRAWVTPKPLSSQPLHRWYIFPHSFTSELVHSLSTEWGLGSEDRLLDPFVGAGTTVLTAKQMGVPATGYDLSPLAVFATRVKISNYASKDLRRAWRTLERKVNPASWNGTSRTYPELVGCALPGKLLGAFDAIRKEIDRLPVPRKQRSFFQLALLRTIPDYSRAATNGGWLRWTAKGKRASSLWRQFAARVAEMLEDVEATEPSPGAKWRVSNADARRLPDASGTFSAVITSPPYPNRHDYTRVFGVELMFGFLDWAATRQLRYQSFHSHPEARPVLPADGKYIKPRRISRLVNRAEARGGDPRVPRMIDGYFRDMYLCLRETKRVCRRGARIGFVVGNARYGGDSIPVDELTAELGELAGLRFEKLMAVRYRGNSAQQMGKFGRSPSRESIVEFRRK